MYKVHSQTKRLTPYWYWSKSLRISHKLDGFILEFMLVIQSGVLSRVLFHLQPHPDNRTLLNQLVYDMVSPR